MTRGLAASKPGCGAAGNSGRARRNVISDFAASTIIPVLTRNVAPGSSIDTDGLKSFAGFVEAGFEHITRIQPLSRNCEKMRSPPFPLPIEP